MCLCTAYHKGHTMPRTPTPQLHINQILAVDPNERERLIAHYLRDKFAPHIETDCHKCIDALLPQELKTGKLYTYSIEQTGQEWTWDVDKVWDIVRRDKVPLHRIIAPNVKKLASMVSVDGEHPNHLPPAARHEPVLCVFLPVFIPTYGQFVISVDGSHRITYAAQHDKGVYAYTLMPHQSIEALINKSSRATMLRAAEYFHRIGIKGV
jgi:hypothetical protein